MGCRRPLVVGRMVMIFLSNINQAVTTYFKISEEEINWGWCFWWAYIAYKLHGGTLCSARGGSHAFVKIGDLFYDSDNHQGCKNYRSLIFECELDCDSEKDFLERWEVEPIHLNPLLQLAQGATMDQVRLQMTQELLTEFDNDRLSY